MAAPSSRKRKCSWISVVPSSSASIGPFTLSTVAIGLLPGGWTAAGTLPLRRRPPCTMNSIRKRGRGLEMGQEGEERRHADRRQGDRRKDSRREVDQAPANGASP